MNLPTMVEVVSALAAQPRLAVRESITDLAQVLKDLPGQLSTEDCPLKHMFAPGVYIREIQMPAGSLIIGRIHKHTHANIISKGRVQVVTEHGEAFMQAPCSFISEAGTQRVVHVLEDCVWATIHPTDQTDIELLEQELTVQSHAEIELQGDFWRTE